MVAAPLIGIAAWMLDGIFIGATETRELRNAALISVAVYAAALALLLPAFGNHGLWAALMVLNLTRGVTLGAALPGARGAGRRLTSRATASSSHQALISLTCSTLTCCIGLADAVTFSVAVTYGGDLFERSRSEARPGIAAYRGRASSQLRSRGRLTRRSAGRPGRVNMVSTQHQRNRAPARRRRATCRCSGRSATSSG